MKALAIATAAALAVVGITSPTHAQEATPAATVAPARVSADHTYVHADLVGRVNPEGGGAIVGLSHVHALDDRAESDWRHATIAVDGTLTASPAHFQASAAAVWTPIQIVPVRVQLDYFGYFGTFGSGLTFE